MGVTGWCPVPPSFLRSRVLFVYESPAQEEPHLNLRWRQPGGFSKLHLHHKTLLGSLNPAGKIAIPVTRATAARLSQRASPAPHQLTFKRSALNCGQYIHMSQHIHVSGNLSHKLSDSREYGMAASSPQLSTWLVTSSPYLFTKRQTGRQCIMSRAQYYLIFRSQLILN